jgi:translation initiation factor 4G
MLSRCQNSFEKYLKAPESLSTLEGEELLEAQLKHKEKMLGNIKLIAELVKNRMLSQKIFQVCCKELLLVCDESTLETLCTFVLALGPFIDRSAKKSNITAMNIVFENLTELSKSFHIPRVRFLIKTVLEQREARWASASRVAEPAPQTKADIRKKKTSKREVEDGEWEVMTSSQRRVRRIDTPIVARKSLDAVRQKVEPVAEEPGSEAETSE